MKNNWRETFSLHWWAAKLWWRIEPKLFLSGGLYALVRYLRPYVEIWFSAQIIDELAGARDPETLWRWVMLTVTVTALLHLTTELLNRWKRAAHGPQREYENRLLAQKMLDMDFAAVEAPRTNDLRFAMRKHEMGNMFGFSKIHSGYLERIVGGIASIIGAAALTVSLFSGQAAAGPWAFLNHPLVSAAVILVLIAGSILSPMLRGKAFACETLLAPYTNLSNRYFNTFGMLGGRHYRALDVRIYQQNVPAREALEQHDPYKKGSPGRKIEYGIRGPYAAASTAVSTLLTGIVYIFVCLKAWAGAFGVGSVTQYVGAVTRLCTGISDLFSVLGDMPSNAAFLRDIRAFLEIPNEMYQGSLPTEKRDDREYEVEFRDVSFQYPRSDVWALRHVNMKFKVGSRLAVVGMNGSGKTTFIKLLCRLYDPTEGQILLNGIDIRKYKYDDYLNIFSVVFQDFQLLALPLGQNVAAAADYDRERAEDCLRKAGFGDRLVSMPKGLDTYLYKELDEDGVEVSGGEAQKIAIARALYKDAPFIILDEPTAALDPVAEAEIYSKFNDIAGDKTAIYISHRLSSCKFCDEIAVFHDGAVIQQGSHAELLADENGKYYELWHAQAQYYTERSV